MMSSENRQKQLLEESRKGLRRAARAAIECGVETKTPVWIWEDGKWADALADLRDGAVDLKPAAGEVVREEPGD